MRTCYVADPASLSADGADEEALLDTVLSTVTGPDNYPGDAEASPNWPMTAPGRRGVLNALSPRWLNLTGIVDSAAKRLVISWYARATSGSFSIRARSAFASSSPRSPSISRESCSSRLMGSSAVAPRAQRARDAIET